MARYRKQSRLSAGGSRVGQYAAHTSFAEEWENRVGTTVAIAIEDRRMTRQGSNAGSTCPRLRRVRSEGLPHSGEVVPRRLWREEGRR